MVAKLYEEQYGISLPLYPKQRMDAEIKARKGINVCANIDFYSGLVYDMLGLSKDLYTLMFVIGRSVGWVAHNIENKLYSGKIIRPAGKYVGEKKEYIKMENR